LKFSQIQRIIHYGASTHFQGLLFPLRSRLPKKIEHFSGRFFYCRVAIVLANVEEGQ